MDKYKEAFREEARELLVELESSLLELDKRPADTELLGRAFRALHTIKGSGAMFGFDEISGFTHKLETTFDELRSGRLAVTASLINLALAAGDQIKGMLDEGSGQTDSGLARSAEILAELERLTGSPESGTGPRPAPQLPYCDDGTKLHNPAPLPPETPPETVARDWLIRFRPASDLFLNGTNPLLLLAELRGLGQLRVKADLSMLPTLGDMDPERCYTAWDMVLATASPRDAIQDVFIFVDNGCELAIEPAPPEAPCVAAPAGAKRTAQETPATVVPAGASSIRVSAGRLDDLVNLVGQLVTVQARLSELVTRRDDPDVLAISEEIERLTAELRENSMGLRMLPLRATFERFRRLVHDLGRELHKDVELAVEGADTELDKTVIDQLNEPLLHLVRNSLDHGIEPPELRRAAGKPAKSKIHLSALHSGANVLIRVTDDGRGLDTEAIRARAIEKGLIDAHAQLSEKEVFSLILAPGFSTAREVTDVSGRGVGMDVVRRSVEALRGSIEIASRPGLGSSVTLRLPLTLAIIDGLLVRVAHAHFVLPLANCLECIELRRQDVEDAHGSHVVTVREEIIPYIRLGEFFGIRTQSPDCEQIMVVETEHGRYGFVVDQVLGDHQTVIKNLGLFYRNVQVVSGATILGDGTVALILDPNRLVQNAVHTLAQDRANQLTRKENRSYGK